MLLGLVGVALGNALGLAVTAYFGSHGIDLGAFEAGLRVMPGLSDVVYPLVRADRGVMLSAIVFASACVAALYPAVHAALLEPVEAIRGLARKRISSGRSGAASSHLPVFVLIAARSILRNPRRTSIVVGGTAFSILAFVFIFGFFDGFFEGMVDNATRYLTGHAQLERAGFRKDLAPELAIGEPQALLDEVRKVPNVAAAARRGPAQALASSAAKSEGVLLIGVDPEVERGVTFVDKAIVEGKAIES